MTELFTRERFPLGAASVAAETVRDMLAPYCDRIEVAGSIRRRRPEVKDIELVAVPRIEEVAAVDLWGTPGTTDRLMERLGQLAAEGSLSPRDVLIHRADGTTETQRRVGSSYQALVYMDIPVDLFIVRPPGDWGVLFTIRTGPAEWSQRLVTDCQRYFRRVEAGRLLHLGKPVPCPEEADFLRAIGQPWVDPWDRSADRVRLRQPEAAA